MAVILAVIVYLIYEVYKEYAFVKDVPNKIIDVLETSDREIAKSTNQTFEQYKAFYDRIPLVPRIAIETGNLVSDVISKTTGLPDIVQERAKAGYEYGVSLNDCRGTLAVSQVSEYNKLTTEEKINFNKWACSENRRKGINVSVFHYAPSVSEWQKTQPAISNLLIESIKSYFQW